MSAVSKLEALITLENDLKSSYESKLEVERNNNLELKKNQATLQATITKQAVQISELTETPSESKRLQHEFRELSNRAANLEKDLEAQRGKSKTIRKELTEAKELIKTLKQLDAEKLKKNLVATKNKLADERSANERLNKSILQYKKDNHELKSSNETLKVELEALKEEELAPEAEAEAEAEIIEGTESSAESNITTIEPLAETA